ncbi:MAG TPA: hypothetical protein DIC64_04145, partial [Alphaproteobacteria bacterium]|nr:hypothetical protein [Alphaproteobacteria bacterium]
EVTIATIKADQAQAINDSGFSVTYSALPAEACINLATADWGSGAGSGFIGVTAGTKATASKVGDANEGRPLSVADAITGCPNDQSSVTLRFY